MEPAKETFAPEIKTAAAIGELPEPMRQLCQLDLWPEPQRGGPNAFLRTALFAAIAGEKRNPRYGTLMEDGTVAPAPVPSQKGYLVSYVGQQLDQYDLAVWLQTMHYGRTHPLETAFTFHGHEFLKAIGKTPCGDNYEALWKSLKRLTEGIVNIKTERYHFVGHLISSTLRDKENPGMFRVTFDQHIVQLFESDYTRLQWKERQALKGKALALWLHGFYASHNRPYPLTVDYLRKLSGAQNASNKSFRYKLKKAFAELEQITGMKATFNDDLITVEYLPKLIE